MKIRTTSRISLLTATAAILALGVVPAAHAANIWDGGGGNGSWNTGSNWDDNAVPAVGGNLTFAGDVQTVTSNDIAAFTAASFLLTNDGTSGKTNSFTLGGNGVTSSASFSIVTTAVTGTAITDTISLNLTLNNNGSINTGASHNLIFSGAILNGTGTRAFSKTGVGELTLTNAGNTYGGTTSINAGILTVDVAGGIANQGVASALGNQSTAANAQLNFNSGTLNVKSGANSTDRQVRIGSNAPSASGGATITNNDLGAALVFSNAAFNVSANSTISAARTLDLGGNNTGANAISGAIIDNATGTGGIINVNKQDSGTWSLGGNNTYTGLTTVTAGTLLINGNSTAATGATSVASGAAIGGDGTIGGNLTLNSGAKFVFDLNDTPLTVNGTFALDSTFGVDDLVTSSLVAIDWSTVGLGTYTLIGTSFTFNAGNIENFGLSNAFSSGGKLMYFENGSLDLVVAVPEPATWALVTLSLTSVMILRRRRRA